MKNPATHKVNDKALNNGLPTIYDPSLTLRNKDLKVISVPDILHAPSQAEGYSAYLQFNGYPIDTSGAPTGTIQIVENDVFVITEGCNYHLNPERDYSAISDTNRIAEIEQSVITAAYVTICKSIAKGEWSVIFALPNDGKTLIILATIVQQIAAGLLNGRNVFYFNLDDARSAYLEKLKILKPFKVIVFDEDPVSVMLDLIKARRAKDKVIVIDTLIRVCDTNNRHEILRLSEICRRFCALGGTVITLAHANKHLGKDGAPVLEGVGLIRSNAHCVSYLQKYDDIIKMVNIKKRTFVEPEVIFQIDKDLPYPDLFASVRVLSGQQAKQLLADRAQDQLILEHPIIIQTIKDAILNGNQLRTALAGEVRDNTGEWLKTIYRVLDELEGKLWKMTKGPNNSKIYTLL
tara:strand:- start:1419 stop:2636 length:1218 start_codon:yes stop_codon:yes gene_type:complete